MRSHFQINIASTILFSNVFFLFNAIFIQDCYSKDDLQINADNQTYYGYNSLYAKKKDKDTLKHIFENWTSFGLSYVDFKLDITYEAHLPAPDWSFQTTGQGIYERSISYKKGNIGVATGTFYTLLGKGIVYRSYRNRDLRYTSNIDGVQVKFYNPFLDLNVFGGRPSDFTGERHHVLRGGEIRVNPVTWGFAGITYASSHIKQKESQWGSAYAQFQGNWGNFYSELASRDFLSRENTITKQKKLPGGRGTALYSVSNFFIYDLTMLLELAYYDSFDISEGKLLFNSPPLSIKEHSSTFMNRATPSFSSNNHVGLHADFSYAFTDDINTSLVLSRARMLKKEIGKKAGEKQKDDSIKIYEKDGIASIIRCLDFVNDSADYSDLYLKGELLFPENIDWIFGAGLQKSLEYRNINLTINNDIGLKNDFSMQLGFEHQHFTVLRTDQKYFNQLYNIMIARSDSPRASLSFTLEYTTDQKSEKKVWAGLQTNWAFYENSDITVFVGDRKKGKSCAGGFCVFKPEFSGFEVTFTTKL